MSTDAAVLATARTNTTAGSVVPVPVNIDEDLLLFDPKNNQLLVVPRQSAKAFLQEANHMQSLAAKLATAREEVLALEEQLATELAKPHPSVGATGELERKLKLARTRYEAAYEAVRNDLGKDGYLSGAGDGKELLELLPLARRKDGSVKEWGRKWTYVRSDKMRNHWRSYKLSSGDSSAAQSKSFIKQGRIDPQALREQFGKLEPKLKAEWKLDPKVGHLFPNLQAWAGALNVKSDPNKPVQFNAGVHLFRYFAGAGAGVEWNPRGGKVAGKLNGKAELMLGQGECSASGYLPNPQGWAWALVGARSGREFHIGEVRFSAEVKLAAAAGASIAAELGVEVDYTALASGGAKGSRRPAKASASSARKVSLADVKAEGSAGADAFAGVRASCEFKGGLQYKNPEKNDEFDFIASVGPKVEGQFGAGAAAALLIDYRKGKFRIKVKAGLCLGPGAKGEIGLEVDARRLGSFMEWFFHALLNANFEVLEVFTKTGFDAATRLQVMMVKGINNAYSNVLASWKDLADQMEREDQNIELMKRVLRNPPELRFCTPEAHGIILHHLTRHSMLTKLAPANTGWNFEIMAERKKAVLQVCRWAQTQRQFENMIQHIHPEGQKGGFKGNLNGLMRFMEIGPFNSRYDDELMRVYQRLPSEPASGYAVTQNHTPQFMAQARMGARIQYLATLRSRSNATALV